MTDHSRVVVPPSPKEERTTAARSKPAAVLRPAALALLVVSGAGLGCASTELPPACPPAPPVDQTASARPAANASEPPAAQSVAPPPAPAAAPAKDAGGACKLAELPIPDQVRDAVLTPISSHSSGVASSLTETEKFMLTRAYALSIKLKDSEKTCAARADTCKAVPAQDVSSLPWDASKFWGVIGTSGCEAADDFKTRIAIDYKMGQIQVGTRTGDDQYRRVGIDLCQCAPNAPLRVIVQADLGYGSASTPEAARTIGLSALTTAEQSTPPAVPGDTAVPPETMALVKAIHDKKKLVVATLGFARGNAFPAGNYALRVMWTLAYLDAKLSGEPAVDVEKAADKRKIGGVITGGYWGKGDNVYGVTRAGFDVARFLGVKALVVTPLAGMADTHLNPDSRTMAGELWGDDSISLVAAADMAIVYYRSSKGESPTSMGRWTQVEVAHLKKQGVPFIFIDIDKVDLKADMDAALTKEVLNHKLVKAALGKR